jgi:hypothetical protein
MAARADTTTRITISTGTSSPETFAWVWVRKTFSLKPSMRKIRLFATKAASSQKISK